MIIQLFQTTTRYGYVDFIYWFQLSLFKSLTAEEKLAPFMEYSCKYLVSKKKSPSDRALLELKKEGRAL